MAKMFVTKRFMQSSPTVQGVVDRRQVHFHFRPVRPADIAVSLDPVSGEVNLAAGHVWHHWLGSAHRGAAYPQGEL